MNAPSVYRHFNSLFFLNICSSAYCLFHNFDDYLCEPQTVFKYIANHRGQLKLTNLISIFQIGFTFNLFNQVISYFDYYTYKYWKQLFKLAALLKDFKGKY